MAEAKRTVAVGLKAEGIDRFAVDFNRAGKAVKDFGAQAGKINGSAANATKQLGASAKVASGDLDKASRSAKAFGDATGKAAKDADKAAKSTKDVGSAASTVGTGLAVAGTAIAAGVGLAVKAFADFDREMSEVRAVSGTTAQEMDLLTQAALDAGAATVFSASQAAQAEAELVKAGISVQDVLGGALKGSLDLASAGSLDLATAATISANAMNIFSLEGKDVGRIADVLAAGANKSAADVNQLGQALEQSGLVASQMGLSLEETVGILSAFADNGLKGSDAGTSFKTMLQRLTPQSVAAAEAMEDIGFSAYDAQGNLKEIDVVAQELRTSLSGLTEEQRNATLNTIFGADAVRGASIAFKLGADGVKEYTGAVTGTTAATDVARDKLNNLSGDLENLRGSFETALIKGGSGANDALRGLTQGATDVVNAFAGLPPAVQEGAVQIAAVTAGVLLLGGGLATAIPKIVATKEAFDALSVSSPKAAAGLGLVAKSAGVLAAATASIEIQNMAAAASVAEQPVDDLAKGLVAVADGAEQSKEFGALFARGAGVFRQEFEDSSDALEDFGRVANSALNSRWYETILGTEGEAESIFSERIEQIDAALVKLVQGGKTEQAAAAADRLSSSITQFGGNADQVRSQLIGYNAAVGGAAIAGGKFADATGKLAGAAAGATGPGKLLGDEIKEQKKAAEDAEQAYKDLTDAVKNYGSTTNAALTATSGFEKSIDDAAERSEKRAEIQRRIQKLSKEDAKGNADEIARLKKELEGYAKSLDLGTEAGRANVASLQEIAAAAKNSAVANYDNGVAFDTVKTSFMGARDEFIKRAIDFGASPEKAQEMADKLGLTKENLDKLAQAPPANVKVNADTAAADTAIANTGALLDATDGRVATATIEVTTTFVGQQMAAGIEQQIAMLGGTLEQRATGGPIRGPGTGTSDSILMWGSNGEFMQPARAVDYYGPQMMEDIRRLRFPKFANGGPILPKFASSGSVSAAITNNSGGNVTNDRRIHIDKVEGADVRAIEREAERRRRLDSLGTRRAR